MAIMYYFIVNPNSRSGQGQVIWLQLQKVLSERKVAYQAYLTEYVGHAKELAAFISQKGSFEDPISLIAVGGDGTIHEVLTGISDFDRILFGFIPTGSGNDFCRGMRLPSDPLKALDVILSKEHIQTIDVPYLVTGNQRRRFGISAGMGFDAAVCQGVQSSAFKKVFNFLKLGKLIYVFIALRQILFMNPSPMTLSLDGNRDYHFPKVYFAAVMNLKYEGGGFCFCPSAKYDDGILDVIVVEKMSRLKFLFCLPTALWGKHTRFRGIHVLRCREVTMTSTIPLVLHMDGEMGGLRTNMRAGIETTPLKIFMPKRSN